MVEEDYVLAVMNGDASGGRCLSFLPTKFNASLVRAESFPHTHLYVSFFSGVKAAMAEEEKVWGKYFPRISRLYLNLTCSTKRDDIDLPLFGATWGTIDEPEPLLVFRTNEFDP